VRKGIAACKSFRQIARELNCAKDGSSRSLQAQEKKKRLLSESTLDSPGAPCSLSAYAGSIRSGPNPPVALDAAQSRQRLLAEERRSDF